MNRKIIITSWLFILSFSFYNCSEEGTKVPFPKALLRANIEVNQLNDILNGALIIGNGDINALVYSDSTSLIMNLTKNDVWDARLETFKDPPIPTQELIKKLGSSESAFPIKNSNSGSVLPEGETWEGKDSYHSNAYPCPRQCGQIRMKKTK